MKILAVRDVANPKFYDIIRDFIRDEYPWSLSIDTVSLYDDVDTSRYDVVVFWLQDPLNNRRGPWNRALELADNSTVPVVQHPICLPNARKHIARPLIFEAGLITPRANLILSVDSFVRNVRKENESFPIYVREDAYHESEMYLIREGRDLNDAVEVGIRCLAGPLKVQYVETKSLQYDRYIKYRCVVTGDVCTPLHVQTSPGWVTREQYRIKDETAQRLEREYVTSPIDEDTAAKFVCAAKKLGMDFCAFDYAIHEGSPIVWEVNPYPFFRWTRETTEHAAIRDGAMRNVLHQIVDLYSRKTEFWIRR